MPADGSSAPHGDQARTESNRLHERVRRFIDESAKGQTLEPFDALATDIARFQAAHIPSIRRLHDARGITKRSLVAAEQIPAVPTELFRMKRIACHPSNEDQRLFQTSGTTSSQQQRGQHPMRTTQTYVHSAMNWGPRWLWPEGPDIDMVIIASNEVERPESSLGFMLARFSEAIHGTSSWHEHAGRLDLPGLETRLEAICREGRPVLVAGTSFGFVHLSDAVGQKHRLPSGSRVMQTGGFKGQSRQVEPETLGTMIERSLGVSTDRIVSEYGMTELSSQLYTGQLTTGSKHYHAPPWLQVRAVDPISLEPLAKGQVGIARFVDLANVDSSVAIQTADLIRNIDENSIELLGRAPGAQPRGCSLALEHLLTAQKAR